MALQSKKHWEELYRTRPAAQVSWYQQKPRVSLRLIEQVAKPGPSNIIDVGGGASTLVDGLLERGYENITVLDIAQAPIEIAQGRLEKAAHRVKWLVADVLTYPFAPGSFEVWHDRAVFHFLTEPRDRRAYVKQVQHALSIGGHVIVATFGPNGPSRCSGLEVCRYEPELLLGEFGQDFKLLDQVREDHVTPAGIIQPFLYCLFAYRSAEAPAP